MTVPVRPPHVVESIRHRRTAITQIELRDRSDFSKSKVSQTVSDPDKRGLLYRERQGWTYCVYPSDELAADEVPSNSHTVGYTFVSDFTTAVRRNCSREYQ